MDTNEKTGNTPEEQKKDGALRPSAPKMDGISAGSRPRRPAGAKRKAEADSTRKPGARPRTPAEGEKAKAGTGKTPEREGQKVQRRTAGESASRRPRNEKPEAPRRKRAPEESAQPQRPTRRSTEEPRKKAAPAKKSAPARKPAQGDSGYQPYRQANRRKKAQRSGNIKTFFSSQNPVLKWFERVRYNKDSFATDSDLAKKRKQQRQEEAEKRRKRQNVFSGPAVIYTQPAAFNRDRLLVQLMTVLAVVAAFMVGLSLFFKVKVITVSGAGVYSPYTIQEASGISEGENLLTLGRNRAAGQILAKLPYVKSVRIGIKLPDTVNIEIVEDDVVYAIQSDTGIWWLMNSQGKVTEMANNSVAKNYTQILGVTLTDPAVGAIGVPTELTADQTSDPTNATDVTDASAASDTTTLPTVTGTVVTGAQRMAAVLEILQALEENDIVGEVASVDVSQLNDVVLWYGTQYQVNLGDANDTVHSLKYKIACMYDAILQMTDYSNGILDVSFTTWENQVGLTPFS